MSDEKIKLAISVKKETYDRIINYIDYFNLRNTLVKDEKPEMNIENFIKGAIIDELIELEALMNPVVIKNSDLAKEGKLKNNLKKIAREDGIKNLDISELTGIDKTTLSQIFNNHQQPSLDYFLRIWSVLGYPPLRRCFYREM
jgi:DNA-binding XRE family transcriptional regulator